MVLPSIVHIFAAAVPLHVYGSLVLFYADVPIKGNSMRKRKNKH